MSSKVKAIVALASGAVAVATWPAVAIYKQCSRDAQGYNKYGYDKNGFDRSGFNRKGYNKDGYDKQGYDIYGYNRAGFKRDGYNKDGYDKEGYNRSGYNKDGYNRNGLNIGGFDRDGFGQDGFNKYDFDREGFNRKGYSKNGFNRNGLDIDGFDRDGYNVYGVNRAGLSKEQAFDLLNQQKERCSEAFQECQNGRYDEMLNKCRKIMECILIYICKVEKCYTCCHHQPPTLDDMIQVCRFSSTISTPFAHQLEEAKDYCNRGSHYQPVDEKFNNVWFSYKTTEELIDFWEKNYIFS